MNKMAKVSGNITFGDRMLGSIADIKSQKKSSHLSKSQSKEGPSFLDYLEQGIKDTNAMQKMAETKAKDLATGKKVNLHETMLSSSYAELSFKLMVQMRNKALEAYQEVMRMPV